MAATRDPELNKFEPLNHTSIPYRQLVIPCCLTCNNEPLARMEDDVSRLLCGPFRRVSEYEEFRLFQWCSKILYGLLHRQKMLSLDRSNRRRGTIVTKSFLEELTTFHHFMTSIRRPFQFLGFRPYSIFVFETFAFANSKRNFDYLDLITFGRRNELSLLLTIGLRVRNFGIICICGDNGLQKEYFQPEFDRFNGIPLHPLQFIELYCKASYKHSSSSIFSKISLLWQFRRRFASNRPASE